MNSYNKFKSMNKSFSSEKKPKIWKHEPSITTPSKSGSSGGGGGIMSKIFKRRSRSKSSVNEYTSVEPNEEEFGRKDRGQGIVGSEDTCKDWENVQHPKILEYQDNFRVNHTSRSTSQGPAKTLYSGSSSSGTSFAPNHQPLDKLDKRQFEPNLRNVASETKKFVLGEPSPFRKLVDDTSLRDSDEDVWQPNSTNDRYLKRTPQQPKNQIKLPPDNTNPFKQVFSASGYPSQPGKDSRGDQQFQSLDANYKSAVELDSEVFDRNSVRTHQPTGFKPRARPRSTTPIRGTCLQDYMVSRLDNDDSDNSDSVGREGTCKVSVPKLDIKLPNLTRNLSTDEETNGLRSYNDKNMPNFIPHNGLSRRRRSSSLSIRSIENDTSSKPGTNDASEILQEPITWEKFSSKVFESTPKFSQHNNDPQKLIPTTSEELKYPNSINNPFTMNLKSNSIIYKESDTTPTDTVAKFTAAIRDMSSDIIQDEELKFPFNGTAYLDISRSPSNSQTIESGQSKSGLANYNTESSDSLTNLYRHNVRETHKMQREVIDKIKKQPPTNTTDLESLKNEGPLKVENISPPDWPKDTQSRVYSVQNGEENGERRSKTFDMTNFEIHTTVSNTKLPRQSSSTRYSLSSAASTESTSRFPFPPTTLVPSMSADVDVSSPECHNQLIGSALDIKPQRPAATYSPRPTVVEKPTKKKQPAPPIPVTATKPTFSQLFSTPPNSPDTETAVPSLKNNKLKSNEEKITNANEGNTWDQFERLTAKVSRTIEESRQNILNKNQEDWIGVLKLPPKRENSGDDIPTEIRKRELEFQNKIQKDTFYPGPPIDLVNLDPKSYKKLMKNIKKEREKIKKSDRAPRSRSTVVAGSSNGSESKTDKDLSRKKESKFATIQNKYAHAAKTAREKYERELNSKRSIEESPSQQKKKNNNRSSSLKRRADTDNPMPLPQITTYETTPYQDLQREAYQRPPHNNELSHKIERVINKDQKYEFGMDGKVERGETYNKIDERRPQKLLGDPDALIRIEDDTDGSNTNIEEEVSSIKSRIGSGLDMPLFNPLRKNESLYANSQVPDISHMTIEPKVNTDKKEISDVQLSFNPFQQDNLQTPVLQQSKKINPFLPTPNQSPVKSLSNHAAMKPLIPTPIINDTIQSNTTSESPHTKTTKDVVESSFSNIFAGNITGYDSSIRKIPIHDLDDYLNFKLKIPDDKAHEVQQKELLGDDSVNRNSSLEFSISHPKSDDVVSSERLVDTPIPSLYSFDSFADSKLSYVNTNKSSSKAGTSIPTRCPSIDEQAADEIKNTGSASTPSPKLWKLYLKTNKPIPNEPIWYPVWVKLFSLGRKVRLYRQQFDKHAFQEISLQPTYECTPIFLQPYDAYGKILVTKLQHATYKETMLKAGIAVVVNTALSGTTTTMPYVREATTLLKLGCHDSEYLDAFVSKIEDTLFKLEAYRELTTSIPSAYTSSSKASGFGAASTPSSGYSKEQVFIWIKEEYSARIVSQSDEALMNAIDYSARRSRSSAARHDGTFVRQNSMFVTSSLTDQRIRVRMFCLAFLRGMPVCELGLNDIRRAGTEVVGRKEIIPCVSDEWIRINTKSLKFHSCVFKDEFGPGSKYVVRFLPLDAIRFELLRLTVPTQENFDLPIKIKIKVVRLFKNFGAHRIKQDDGDSVPTQTIRQLVGFKIICDLVSTFTVRHAKIRNSTFPCHNVMVGIPIPLDWIYLFREEKTMKFGSKHSTTRVAGKIKGLKRFLIFGTGQNFEDPEQHAQAHSSKMTSSRLSSSTTNIPSAETAEQGAFENILNEKFVNQLVQDTQGPPLILETTCGLAKYENVYRSLVWRIPKLSTHKDAFKEQRLLCVIKLGSHDVVPEDLTEIMMMAKVEYDIETTYASNLMVRSLSVTRDGESNPNVDKEAHYNSHFKLKVKIVHSDSDDGETKKNKSTPQRDSVKVKTSCVYYDTDNEAESAAYRNRHPLKYPTSGNLTNDKSRSMTRLTDDDLLNLSPDQETIFMKDANLTKKQQSSPSSYFDSDFVGSSVPSRVAEGYNVASEDIFDQISKLTVTDPENIESNKLDPYS